jgi:flagellar basal-body rod modification protein FlgD
MISPTANIAPSTDNSLSYATRVPMQKLGQDEFIKILVTQLRSQDPLNPQKDTEFVGQMAQFSALESTKMMQDEIKSLRANSLLGQTVEIAGEENNVIGEVSSVDKIQGEIKIIVDGVAYSLEDVIRVARTEQAQEQPQAQPPGRDFNTTQ